MRHGTKSLENLTAVIRVVLYLFFLFVWLIRLLPTLSQDSILTAEGN